MVRPQLSHTGPPSPGAGASAVPNGDSGSETPETQLWRACSELSRRLRCGEPGSAEQFLAEFPTLAEHDDLALDLICTEFQVRRELGQRPDPAAWCARFPQWQDRLRRQLEDLPAPPQISPTAVVTVAEPLPAGTAAPVARAGAAGPAPRYELLEELGHGGMGVVYRARDTVLGRLVAVKMVRAGRATADGLLRFRREAQAVARLRHRHIVALHDFGERGGEPFLVMPYIGGGNLSGRLGDFGDPREAAVLVEKVARAVQAAHDAGIVHRDLKPANVLLDEEGEPLVGDFGLAKFLDPEPGEEATYTGQLVGTPAYMTPEQAAGQGHRATPATDVWALGVILYELLTGQKPFRGQGPEVTPRIQHEAPAAPRSLRPGLDRALETVVLKCLEKEPVRRYPSAGELADDLARWLRGEPVRVRPQAWISRVWQRARSRRAWPLAGVFLVALLATAAVVVLRAPGPSPTEREARRLQEARAALEHDLVEGRAVTLVREVGPPRYYRWRTETNRPPLPDRPDLEIESWRTCLLELLAGPQRERYLFQAEVRQGATRDGHVGIYFSADERSPPEGPEHTFRALTFADKGESAKRLRLDCYRYREGDLEHSRLHQTQALWRTPFAGEANWHQLGVEITPEKVVCFWDGKLVHELARTEERPLIDRWWRGLDLRPPTLPPPSFAPRGSLGLFAENSMAVYRNVVVTPR
jgi:hypothetical protein